MDLLLLLQGWLLQPLPPSPTSHHEQQSPMALFLHIFLGVQTTSNTQTTSAVGEASSSWHSSCSASRGSSDAPQLLQGTRHSFCSSFIVSPAISSCSALKPPGLGQDTLGCGKEGAEAL